MFRTSMRKDISFLIDDINIYYFFDEIRFYVQNYSHRLKYNKLLKKPYNKFYKAINLG